MNTLSSSFTAVFISLLIMGGARADTVLVISDYWYPYNGTPGDQREGEGYKIDLLRLFASETGRRIEYRLLDWELALSRTEEGSGGDCVVGAIPSDAPRHVLSTELWGISENMLYAHVDRVPDITTIDDLRGLRIGVVTDYSYGDELDELLADEAVQVTRIEASRRAFPRLVLMLATNQVDVIIEDVNVANVGFRELAMRRSIRAIDVDWMEPDPVHLACTPNERGRGIIADFDKAMTRARSNGSLAGILERYNLQDWKQAD